MLRVGAWQRERPEPTTQTLTVGNTIYTVSALEPALQAIDVVQVTEDNLCTLYGHSYRTSATHHINQ